MKIVISDTPPYFLDLDAPTLPAHEHTDDDSQVMWGVWCRHCDQWHWHGPGEGHRLAHCQKATPYQPAGYNLADAGPLSEQPVTHR